MRIFAFAVLILVLFSLDGVAQLETRWIDTTTQENHEYGYFFSNRPLKKSEEGVVAFRNRWTRQTGNLYFCLYDYEKDSIMLKYQVTKTSALHMYPTDPLQDNIFYGIYDNMVVKRGIQSLIIVIPGYGKTFKQQVKDFMFRLNENYMSSMRDKMAIIMFAWGDQSLAPFYHKGKRAASRAANDFAIFQHMLEDFLADTAYREKNPFQASFSLVCTSMGNQLLKKYLLKREKRGIPLVPAYDRIVMIGSDAACDSFEEGKGFHQITKMTRSVSVLVNRKDGPLTLSQYMNLKNRMGKSGPTNLDELPDNIRVWDITGVIAWEDLPAMGHDYLLRNSVIREQLLYEETSFQEMKYLEQQR